MNSLSFRPVTGPAHLRQRFAQFASQRAGLWVALALGSATVAGRGSTVGGHEMLADALATSVDGTVDVDSIVLAKRASWLHDAVVGRQVLFLAAAHPEAPNDVYRAFLSETLDGKPLRLARLRNLTKTPVGDDVELRATDEFAAFATKAYGGVQSVTILRTAGIPVAQQPRGLLAQLMLSITALQTTGDTAGVGQTDLVFEVPPRSAVLSADERGVHARLHNAALDYDLADGRLTAPDALRVRVAPRTHRKKPLVLWTVDTVRAEVGPEPIAWLEREVFNARDRAKRFWYGVSAPKAKLKRTATAPSVVADDVQWPPRDIVSIWEKPEAGEGAWKATEFPWLSRLQAHATSPQAPPAFFQTFIRPDAKRPYSKLHLVAMDMRQLELGMQAGYEDPEPLTGPRGSGRVPKDRGVHERLVATFNGAFKTTHGKYGMMVDRRVLLPPVPGAATIALHNDGRVGLGGWPATETVPDDLVSFRQNLDPLVEDGRANPTNRYMWGWEVKGQTTQTERSALCVTGSGALIYAWAKEIDGPTLGLAMKQTGCAYAMHLDMNPMHCGFVFMALKDYDQKKYHLARAVKGMGIYKTRYVEGSPKDFFYMTRRRVAPTSVGALKWTPDGAPQPPPAWLPSVWIARQDSVTVRLIARDRFHWTLARPGTAAANASIAIGLGESRTLTEHDGAVVVDGGALHVAPSSTSNQLAALHVLTRDGRELPLVRSPLPTGQRLALCETGDGMLRVAEARASTFESVTKALTAQGCGLVLAAHDLAHATYLSRQTAAAPATLDAAQWALVGTPVPERQRAFRWKAEGSQRASKPTGFDYRPPKKKKKRNY